MHTHQEAPLERGLIAGAGSSPWAREPARLSAYRVESDRYVIELKLSDERELFNDLDPSPFHRKDLDADAEDYIVGAVHEIGERPTMLVVYLSTPDAAPKRGGAVSDAIRNYFAHRAHHARAALHQLLARGCISLLIGGAFLVLCLWLRRLRALETGSNDVIEEGLLILGWVAMWRPVEIFLYDWWPLFGRVRLCERIAIMPIEVRELARETDAPRGRPCE